MNNKFSARTALQNADNFVAENVDLVIDSQININGFEDKKKFSQSGRSEDRPKEIATSGGL
jgi:hypothetical protein